MKKSKKSRQLRLEQDQSYIDEVEKYLRQDPDWLFIGTPKVFHSPVKITTKDRRSLTKRLTSNGLRSCQKASLVTENFSL